MAIRSIVSPIIPNIPKITLSWQMIFNISIKYVMQSQLKLPTDGPFWSLLPNAVTARQVSQQKIQSPFSSQPMGAHQFCYNYSKFLIMKYLSLNLVSFPIWMNYVELQKFKFPPPHLFLVGSQHIPCDKSRWTHLSHGSDTPHEMPQANRGWGGSIWVKNSAAKLIWDVCRLRKKGTH